jgi:hypothetical protein
VSLDINLEGGKVKHPGKIWSDAAHYYVYMPATFVYHWNYDLFPYHIDKKFQGFIQNDKLRKIEVKTTYGVSLLLSPFFLLAHTLAVLTGMDANGFSSWYQVFMMIGAVFYFTLALFFLKKFLERYVQESVALLTVILAALTTQLYFYAYREVLMSHVYSFFLFSVFIYLLKRYLDDPARPARIFFLLSLSLALAVLVRPTNFVAILWLAFLDLRTAREFWQRLGFFFHPRRSLVYAAVQFAVLIPQFLYWHYFSGKYIFYSYPGEVFYWLNPLYLRVWFSPNNGLFPYNPVFLLVIASMIWMTLTRKANGLFSLVFFVLISHIISSWHCWYYGGSFGSRPFTEFIPFMILPFALLLQKAWASRNLFLRSSFNFFILVLIYFNLTQVYRYNVFTGGTWGWDDYFIRFKKMELLNYPQETYCWKNDFDNVYGYWPRIPDYWWQHSPVLSAYFGPGVEDACHYDAEIGKVLDRPVSRIRISAWIRPGNTDKTGAVLACSFGDPGRGGLYREFRFDELDTRLFAWSRGEFILDIPEWTEQSGNFHLYIKNPNHLRFTIDDMEVEFR